VPNNSAYAIGAVEVQHSPQPGGATNPYRQTSVHIQTNLITMRTLIIFSFLNFISLTAFPTGQHGDIIIWKNEKLTLFSNPLESYPNFNKMRERLFGVSQLHVSTACVRGYIAEWQINDETLYLTNIYDCEDYNIKANLDSLFPGKCRDGKILADWVNEVLIVVKGKCMLYGNIGYSAIYETEFELTVSSGKLVKEIAYDNSMSHVSIFTQNSDSLLKFIYHNIMWDKIPDTLNNPVRVILSLSTTDTNRPEIKIIRGSGIELYDDEALRVASLIPDWDMYFQRGKVFKMYLSLPIVFDIEKKIKYGH